MHGEPPVPIESLLEHRAWVRGLARVPAAGPADADDLEQEAWLASLRGGPDTRAAARGWLGGVLRRQAARAWRARGRRERRERGASRTEALPSAAEVVERTETHRRIVDAVLALVEPYRTTVLLRFFEDLPPREVARRTGAPVETVRSRLRRALLDLRERFEREERTVRRPWQAAFLALADEGPPAGGGPAGASAGAATAAGGLAAMTTATKTGIGLAVVLALGAVAWLVLWADDEPRRAGDDGRREVARGERRAPEARPEVALRGAPVAPPATPAPVPEAPVPVDRPVVLVVSGEAPDAAGVAGARVTAVRPDGAAFEQTTDASGRAALPSEAVGAAVLWVGAAGRATLRHEGAPLAAGREERVVLDPGAVVGLRFVDLGTLQPLPAEEVQRAFEARGVEPHAELVWADALVGTDMRAMLRTVMGSADLWRRPVAIEWQGGAARLADRVAPGAWRFLAWTPSGLPTLSEPFRVTGDASIDADVPVLVSSAVRRIRVVDGETGAPLPGARLRAYHEYGDDQAFFAGPPLAADGRGEIDLPQAMTAPAGPGRASSPRPPTWWAETDSHAGRLIDHEVARADPGSTYELRILRTATVEGKAYTSEGAPAVGLLVTSWQKGRIARTRVDADGRYRLAGIACERPEGRSEGLGLIEDLDAGKVVMAKAQVKPGQTTSLDIGVPATSGERVTVEGVVTAGGRPLAGLFVLAGNPKGSGRAAATAQTDADGRFRFATLSPGAIEVLVSVSDPRASDDYSLRTTEPLALRAGETRTLRADLPGGAVRVRVLDAASGEPVSGSVAAAQPPGRSGPDTETLPGWAWRPGNAAFATSDGNALLRALPSGPLEVSGHAPGYESAQVANVTAGTEDAPVEVVLRLAKKP